MSNEPPLTIELVPQTAWWSNVRSHVSKADWKKCQDYARSKTDNCCIICGQSGRTQGRKHDTEAHEIWHYDDDNQIQTLVDIWPLCPRCHQCKHLGRSRSVMGPQKWAELIAHFQEVNSWPDWKVERYVELVFSIWRERSRLTWGLDITLLNLLGIEIADPSMPNEVLKGNIPR